jgi:GT2 family glycosyltransferase
MSEAAKIADGPGEPGLVSVIIPTYNRAYILGEAIESVLQQTYRSVEVVVVDDGSTDNTQRVIEGYGPLVHYFCQSNAGVSAARNFGLRQARGEFIALLDSDDCWRPWKLEAQVHLLRRFPELGMVWTDMTAVDESGKLLYATFLRKMYSAHALVAIESICEFSGTLGELWCETPAELASHPFYRGDIFSYMFLGNLVHTSTVLLRRERLRRVGGFDEALWPSGEDYDFHWRTCSHGPVGFLDAPSIQYRLGSPDQLTSLGYKVHIAKNNLATVLKCWERERGRLQLPRSLIQWRLADSFGWLGEEQLLAGDLRNGRKNLWRSLRQRPWQVRRALLLLYGSLPRVFRRAVRKMRGRSQPNGARCNVSRTQPNSH